MIIQAAGTATLVGGTVTVSTTAVQSTSVIMLTRKQGLGTLGEIGQGTIVAGTSFVINSLNILDISVVNWMIVG